MVKKNVSFVQKQIVHMTCDTLKYIIILSVLQGQTIIDTHYASLILVTSKIIDVIVKSPVWHLKIFLRYCLQILRVNYQWQIWLNEY